MRKEGPQFWFRSDLFQIEPAEDQETNPLRYGKQLAAWIASRFRSAGYPSAEVVPEDWGWCVMLQTSPFLLWVGCGNCDPDFDGRERAAKQSNHTTNSEAITWSCFVGTDVLVWTTFYWRRLVGRADTAGDVARIAQALESFLRNESRIQMAGEP